MSRSQVVQDLTVQLEVAEQEIKVIGLENNEYLNEIYVPCTVRSIKKRQQEEEHQDRKEDKRSTIHQGKNETRIYINTTSCQTSAADWASNIFAPSLTNPCKFSFGLDMVKNVKHNANISSNLLNATV
eukprot:805263_1